MNSLSPALALVSTIVATLALGVIWSGSESIHFNWVAMPDDYSEVEFVTLQYPQPESYSYTADTPEPEPELKGENFLLWINISGFRGDYLEDAETPFFDEVLRAAYHSSELVPVFPTFEYPNLISQATGLSVSDHRIAGDAFKTAAGAPAHERPSDLSLLGGEPIWTLAKRQGLSVLVHDWPFSQEQAADAPADLHIPDFDPSLTDEQRLDALLEAWKGFSSDDSKIRLVMANLHGLHQAARTNGSRQEETLAFLTELDSTLRQFFGKLEAAWPELSSPGDKLYVILGTDHGTSDIEKVINFSELMGDLADNLGVVAQGAVAQLWFEGLEGEERDAFAERFDDELRSRIYWRAYTQGDFPSFLNLGDGMPLLGDRVLVLKQGYGFTDDKGSEPVFAPSEVGGPFAVAGYPVSDNARMNGQLLIFRLDGGFGSSLGAVAPEQLYATACEILGLSPNPSVTAKAVRWR